MQPRRGRHFRHGITWSALETDLAYQERHDTLNAIQPKSLELCSAAECVACLGPSGSEPDVDGYDRAMSQVPIWFERKFEYRLPVELLPNLCARLRGTPARLEEMLGNRSEQVLVDKVSEKWSVKEHAGHLLDIEPLWLVRVRDYVDAHEELTATDLRNRKTDEANHNARPLRDILAGFRAARTKLLGVVDELQGSIFERAIPHPRLRTPLRLIDHLHFVAEHDDHHLARMWELLNGAK